MKTAEILGEAPYLHDGEYSPPPGMEKETYHSDNTLSRVYDHLFFEVFDGVRVDFYIQDKLRLVGTIKKKKQKTQEDSNLIVFSLRFKEHQTIVNYPEGISKDKVLQVDSVYTRSEFREFGMASLVYATLVEKGFIIVSDSAQFNDGKQLWKKISREAKFNDYVIHIIDDEEGFLKDKNGKVISYDSSNIDDAKIWSSGMSFHGEHILLMMK